MNPTIQELTAAVEREARKRPDVMRLMTHPGVGPLTALAYVLIIGIPTRFQRGKQVGTYVGMIPMLYYVEPEFAEHFFRQSPHDHIEFEFISSRSFNPGKLDCCVLQAKFPMRREQGRLHCFFLHYKRNIAF